MRQALSDAQPDHGLRALSISHRTASIAELELMTLAPPALAELQRRFHAHGLEAVMLSTCNRIELYTHATRPAEHGQAATLLAHAAGRGRADLGRFTRLSGVAAATHLFRVAGGLESLVVGESEVLGQVRAAIDAAEAAGTAGSNLSGLFRAALRFGGRARSETGIGTGALSVASAAVQLLVRAHADLSACTVLVVGTGATGLKAARHLRAERVGRLVLANRTARRAQEVAIQLAAEAVTLDELPRLLPGFDAVLVAAHVERPIITTVMIEAARRGTRAPLVLIDVSLPRAVDPACAAIAGVTLHDLSGLEQVVAHNRARREREIPRVTALLEHELSRFASRWRARRSPRPVVGTGTR